MSHRPTDEDEKLWKHVTKGIDPYHKKEKKPTLSAGIKARKAPQHENASGVFIPIQREVIRQYKENTPQALDKRTETRLRRGQIKIEARIDLHGMTLEEAHVNLVHFIRQSAASKRRCVLVITGKGRISSPGKIKQNFAHWLYDYPLAGMVLKHVSAQPADGGNGAFYVYLKRQKE